MIRQANAASDVAAHNPSRPTTQGNALARRIKVDDVSIPSIRREFIAFDVETTGLNPAVDRIVEVGAVYFSNGKVVDRFSTLVNPGIPIPPTASAINHITNTMLLSAPSEADVYPKLVNFLGDALDCGIIMCAHNARFDFDFLCNTLSRLGIDGNIAYADTLRLAKNLIKNLPNYKQASLEHYFGLTNTSSHRADSDAENCGHILCQLIDLAEKTNQDERKRIEKKGQHVKNLRYVPIFKHLFPDRAAILASCDLKRAAVHTLRSVVFTHFLNLSFQSSDHIF